MRSPLTHLAGLPVVAIAQATGINRQSVQRIADLVRRDFHRSGPNQL